MRKKILLLAIVLLLIGSAGVGYYVLFYNQDTAGNTLADNTFGWKFPIAKFPPTGSEGNLAYSDIRDPGGIPQGLPVRLKVPAIGVDSAIEDALITPDGRMDVPAGSKNVAWFSLGPHPGKVGSAVIGGHFGIRNGVPFVFYNLDKLRVGDKIYVVNDRDDILAFVVRSIKLFDRDDDATTVFTSDDGLAHLNLITCEGIWNRVNDTYPERRVVFADAIATEAIPLGTSPIRDAATKVEDIAAFPRTFGLGAEGPDVVALQTFLEEKGFLTIPIGIAKGFFGPLSSTAISKYQISAGLSRAGVFGPLTRAKVLSELGGDTGLPNAGPGVATLDGAESSPTWPETLARFIRSLYATPLDGIITFFLLISIAFMAFKIIRRR